MDLGFGTVVIADELTCNHSNVVNDQAKVKAVNGQGLMHEALGKTLNTGRRLRQVVYR